MATWVGHSWHEFDRAEELDCHPAMPGRVECDGMTLYVTDRGAISGWDWHPGMNL